MSQWPEKLHTGTKDKPLQSHHSPLLCHYYFWSCITCWNELVWVFSSKFYFFMLEWCLLPSLLFHLNTKSLQGVLPPMSWRKLLSSFIAFCPPWPCQSKFPLGNSPLQFMQVAPREMLSVQGAMQGGWVHEIFEMQLTGANQ